MLIGATALRLLAPYAVVGLLHLTALFPWHEPVERFLIAADQVGIDYLTPKIGEGVRPGLVGGQEVWWKKYINKAR